MNREILFRGKRVDTGEWVYGNLIYDKDTYRMGIVDGYLNEYKHVQSGTIGQYTGLKDKNGKMIFEGDVVTFWMFASNYTSEVKFNKGCFELHWLGGSGESHSVHMRFAENIEVIGNIHDKEEEKCPANTK